MMSYRGYKGYFDYDEKADIFHSQIIGIQDVVTFQGTSIDELKEALHDSVEDYLEMCESENKSPNKYMYVTASKKCMLTKNKLTSGST